MFDKIRRTRKKGRMVSVLLLSVLLLCGCDSSTIGDLISQGTSHIQSEYVTLDHIPEYDGDAWIEVNGDIPFFKEEEKTTEVFEEYSNLDSLGRCGPAYANLCKELMPTEPRGEIGSVRPSGWHTAKYSGLVDGNYLYNRCHLIGFQLAGENANEKNLITGTRYLNVEGMLPFENELADYIKTTKNHVLYRVTPIYEEENLVASGVLMEAWSVEDDGAGICFCIYCYNVQPQISIDYATGESWLSSEGVAGKPAEKKEQGKTAYVINTGTRKFHTPDCSSVDEMKGQNKKKVKSTRKELLEQGYEPCGKCKP